MTLNFFFLQRMVPFDGRNDTYPQSRVLSPVDVTFNIRPYFPQDKVRHCFQSILRIELYVVSFIKY